MTIIIITWVLFATLLSWVVLKWICSSNKPKPPTVITPNDVSLNDVFWINPNMLLSYHNGEGVVRVVSVDRKNNSITIQELTRK